MDDKTNQTQLDTPRIIVIDDNPAIHEDFRKILLPFAEKDKDTLSELGKALFENKSEDTDQNSLESIHYDVDFASQGQEGIEMVKKAINLDKPYALAFVDVRMPPGLDGIETIQEIWKTDPWIQVVICTAYSDYSWEETIAKLGISDNLLILKKPFDVTEVRQLASALTEKWSLNIKLRKYVVNLEEIVKERTIALEKSLALVRATLESTADGIFVEDLEGRIVDCNEIFTSMWEIPEDILKSNSSKNAVQFEAGKVIDPEAFLAKIESLSKKRDVECIDEINLKDGRCFERYCKPHRMSDKIVGRVWSFRNVSEQKKMQRELLFQATHDKLTNLPNRRLLYDRIMQNIALAKRNKTMVSVLLFDLDNFKNINDSFGHISGDAVLKLVAKRVSEVLRESDTLARLGGDEFVVVLRDDIDEPQTEIVAKKIIDSVIKPFKLFDYDFTLSASIGISIHPQDGDSAEELLTKADGAMYSVKKTEKNGFKFYDISLTQHMPKQLMLANDLKIALQKNQFKLYYQPLIDIHTGNIVSVEAIAKWQHPTLGMLSPEAFLPIAEESGLIIPIGEWVLKTACAQNKQWQSEDLPPLTMAVGISSSQFKYPFFEEIIKKILIETKLSPEYLDLEFTESTLVENSLFMTELLTKIKKLGVGLVIDDFGSGYSSLGYLKQFPFDKLKIDVAFMRDIHTSATNSRLVRNIITVGDELKLKVIAQGIDTKDQVSLVTEYKCDQAQGELFSGPLATEEFSKLLQNRTNLLEGTGT